MKRWVLVLMAVGATLWVMAPVFSQEDMVTVDTSPFEDPQRAASLYRHDAHNEKAGIDDCAECHHVYEDGKKVADENSAGQACSECHGAKAEGPKPSLTQAFHTNCKGCHLQRKEGPVMCGQCHRWRPVPEPEAAAAK
jgi:hypothetical protein